MSQGRVNGLGTHPYELPPSQSVPSDPYAVQRVLRGFGLSWIRTLDSLSPNRQSYLKVETTYVDYLET